MQQKWPLITSNTSCEVFNVSYLLKMCHIVNLWDKSVLVLHYIVKCMKYSMCMNERDNIVCTKCQHLKLHNVWLLQGWNALNVQAIFCSHPVDLHSETSVKMTNNIKCNKGKLAGLSSENRFVLRGKKRFLLQQYINCRFKNVGTLKDRCFFVYFRQNKVSLKVQLLDTCIWTILRCPNFVTPKTGNI